MAEPMFVYVCAGCGAQMTKAQRCEPGCASIEAESVRVFRQEDIEQAWRNGWGSALNFLRGAEDLVRKEAASNMAFADRHGQRVILKMVNQWVALIDSLTEEAVAAARKHGLAAKPEADAVGQERET